MGRVLRSPLDLLLPNASTQVRNVQMSQKANHDRHSCPRTFKVNDPVFICNFNKTPAWLLNRLDQFHTGSIWGTTTSLDAMLTTSEPGAVLKKGLTLLLRLIHLMIYHSLLLILLMRLSYHHKHHSHKALLHRYCPFP